MTVGYWQLEHSRLLFPTSFKGKGRSPQLIKVCIGADVAQVLRPAIVGRRKTEPLLQRWRYRQISATEWVRKERGPWKSAPEMTRQWRRVVAAAGLEGTIDRKSVV